MYDAIKEIMLDFDFKRLDEIITVEATYWAQVTTSDNSEEGLKTFKVLAASFDVPIVAAQDV